MLRRYTAMPIPIHPIHLVMYASLVHKQKPHARSHAEKAAFGSHTLFRGGSLNNETLPRLLCVASCSDNGAKQPSLQSNYGQSMAEIMQSTQKQCFPHSSNSVYARRLLEQPAELQCVWLEQRSQYYRHSALPGIACARRSASLSGHRALFC